MQCSFSLSCLNGNCTWGGLGWQDFQAGEVSVQDKICRDILGVWDESCSKSNNYKFDGESRPRCFQGGDIETPITGEYEKGHIGIGGKSLSDPSRDIIWKLKPKQLILGHVNPIYNESIDYDGDKTIRSDFGA